MPEPNLPLDAVTFAVVDVETTGLGPADRVIEIAALRLRGFEEIARFQSLINPGIPIGSGAMQISGITDAMVSSAPIFPEVHEALGALLADSVFVAHNAPFDLQFLSRERKRWRLASWQGPVLDTLRLARNAIALPGYSLAELTGVLELPHAPAHRAMADVLATAALLQKLVALLQPAPQTLADLLLAQEPIPAAWEECKGREVPDEVIDLLARASRGEEIVEIEYQGRAGTRSYWVRPQGAERNGPLFYVRARVVETEDERSFRLDRLQSARIAGTPPSARVDRDPDEGDTP